MKSVFLSLSSDSAVKSIQQIRQSDILEKHRTATSLASIYNCFNISAVSGYFANIFSLYWSQKMGLSRNVFFIVESCIVKVVGQCN